jgi:hypothetical protein
MLSVDERLDGLDEGARGCNVFGHGFPARRAPVGGNPCLLRNSPRHGAIKNFTLLMQKLKGELVKS